MEGENLTGDDTDRGYDLRSRGPPTFNDKALDTIPNPSSSAALVIASALISWKEYTQQQ